MRATSATKEKFCFNGRLQIKPQLFLNFHLTKRLAEIADLFTEYNATWVEDRINFMASHINNISQEIHEQKFDHDLARAAVAIAMNRHVGRIETVYTLSGATHVQIGKDLTNVRQVIGTGGIFTYGANPEYILEGTKRHEADQLLLKPKRPDFLIDSQYILFAAGLLCDLNKEIALEIMNQHLHRVGEATNEKYGGGIGL